MLSYPPSRPSRGAWIETSTPLLSPPAARRAPRGARGLKLRPRPRGLGDPSRAPRGARGLKRIHLQHPAGGARRAPRGARGLKPQVRRVLGQARLSRPSRGAWIETWSRADPPACAESRPSRGAWIETIQEAARPSPTRRAPRGARGLKHAHRTRRGDCHVAPLAGRVD